ncbi:hypothetical protein FKM82_015466 [Ascaphus truei]
MFPLLSLWSDPATSPRVRDCQRSKAPTWQHTGQHIPHENCTMQSHKKIQIPTAAGQEPRNAVRNSLLKHTAAAGACKSARHK